jgi:hypothetical protein
MKLVLNLEILVGFGWFVPLCGDVLQNTSSVTLPLLAAARVYLKRGR